ncbi:hypothetical protein QPX54_09700 [Corynebacterium propinquum]|uniref:Uncharacterized protein n=1 Tax=Corynebacterium propinquum TaxID=43769 RepID=A0AAP4BVJ1_9CORY|nr:hypothetical protein [Corynebacterium propinquum]MDK4326773.1 hypothetical protein [Corynebacterium propinquum]
MTDNILNVILTTIIATLATITFAGIIRSILGALVPYEEKQARHHDRQARRHLAAIPRTNRDDRLLIAELAAEHQKIADEWRKTCHATNGLHEQEQNYEPNTSNNARKTTHHAGYAANPSTTKQKTSTQTRLRPTTTTHDQRTQN